MTKITFSDLTPYQKNQQLLMYLNVLKNCGVKRSCVCNTQDTQGLEGVQFLKLALGLFKIGDEVLCSIIPGDYVATVVATGYEPLASGGFKCEVIIRYGNCKPIEDIPVEYLRFV
jgi:hypothetical protein